MLVPSPRHPPFKRQSQTYDFHEIERSNVDILIGRSDELHSLLGEEGEVLVNCVFGDVFIGGIVEGDEDVEKDDGDDEVVDVVEDETGGSVSE